LQSISGVSAINPLVAYYDIHGRKKEVLLFWPEHHMRLMKIIGERIKLINLVLFCHRFVGQYEFLNPMVMIKDIELLKKITVKDFEHFLDHRTTINDEIEPFFGRSLLLLKGISLSNTIVIITNTMIAEYHQHSAAAILD
jgi:hypothetical protein